MKHKTDCERMSVVNQIRFLKTRLKELRISLSWEKRLNPHSEYINNIHKTIEITENQIKELENGKCST